MVLVIVVLLLLITLSYYMLYFVIGYMWFYLRHLSTALNLIEFITLMIISFANFTCISMTMTRLIEYMLYTIIGRHKKAIRSKTSDKYFWNNNLWMVKLMTKHLDSLTYTYWRRKYSANCIHQYPRCFIKKPT